MNRASSFACLAAGLAAGVTLIVACGDDSPGDIDAADASASCDCPAAEPPLGGRITRVRGDNVLNPGGIGGSAAFCPVGSVALGGACEMRILDANVVLMSSSFTLGDAPGYRCDWETVGATMPYTGTAEVVCLTPAP